MSELFWNTVTADMRGILNEFSRSQVGGKFYLAGGTALSLQLGHRLSVDLDFFSPTEDIPTIRPVLEKSLAAFQPTLADSAWGNLVYLARNIRIGFYGYGYELVAPLVEDETMRLASVEDIALMKLDALLARAARKDFYDLYFICQKVSLRKILNLAPKKYPSTRDFETQTVKRLTYFENAEQDVEPTLLHPASWQSVKEYFIEQAKDIGRGWLE
jgi:predicted nucleotidyltransferase component of viral defense system